jgi:hypothetical protein
LFIERVDGIDRVKVTVEIGSRLPAYASATGKVLLASLSDEEIKQRFGGTKFSSVYTEDHFLACRTPGRNQDHPFAGFCCERPGKQQGTFRNIGSGS